MSDSYFAKEIIPVNIEDEMKRSYLDYAMSVIIGRALPDVRDGLKPVHRRALYAMRELNNSWNKPYKKSARVVGDVIGKYHPHGDTAAYDTIVRMAQPFSMRHMLIDGQGNFGSVDGDSPAAMRYTEVRMAKISHELLADLDKETVDFLPNYDESESEPSVLPTKIPTLLVNGSAGIAVGMATNIPPHNLGEVINACLALIDNHATTIEQLMQYIPGPDFPTAALINGTEDMLSAYQTGRGRVCIRARCHFEEADTSGKQAIIVTQLPYQINKARLLKHIGELIKEGRIEGITALRDESDKDGMRMYIELRRGEVPAVILNKLYQYTKLQTAFGINMVAIINGRPQCLNLKEILSSFIDHRREIVTRRTLYDLRKARERAHTLEGLAVALANIDAMIKLIKVAKNPTQAKQDLLNIKWDASLVATLLESADISRSRPEGLSLEFGIIGNVYQLSAAQAQAILSLQLHRLTGLEQEKIIDEYKQLLEQIDDYLDILGSDERLTLVICSELEKVKEQFADARRTEIIPQHLNLSAEDLIAEEDVVVTVSHQGYVKSQVLDVYKAQKRGGRGKSATTTKESDFVDKLIVANTHDTILCFSSCGKVYWLKAYQLPTASRIGRGKPFINLFPLQKGEQINAILSVREYSEQQYIFMATAKGTVKKTPLKEFERQRTNGKIAISLRENDQLVGVAVTDGQNNVLLFSSAGKAVCFSETQIRSSGRTATGVRGIRIDKKQKVISLIVASEGAVFNITENGFGKRTLLHEFTQHKRGGKGMIAIKTSGRNGAVVGAVLVTDNDEIMLITNGGTLVRTRINEISIVGRNTQGVTVIKLGKKEKVVGVARITNMPDDNDLAVSSLEAETNE